MRGRGAFSDFPLSPLRVLYLDVEGHSLGDPRGFKVALRFDPAMLPWTQGNNTGTLLALIPRSNQKEIAQFIETVSRAHFPHFSLTLKPVKPVNARRRGYIRPEIPRFRAYSVPERPLKWPGSSPATPNYDGEMAKSILRGCADEHHHFLSRRLTLVKPRGSETQGTAPRAAIKGNSGP